MNQRASINLSKSDLKSCLDKIKNRLNEIDINDYFPESAFINGWSQSTRADYNTFESRTALNKNSDIIRLRDDIDSMMQKKQNLRAIFLDKLKDKLRDKRR